MGLAQYSEEDCESRSLPIKAKVRPKKKKEIRKRKKEREKERTRKKEKPQNLNDVAFENSGTKRETRVMCEQQISSMVQNEQLTLYECHFASNLASRKCSECFKGEKKETLDLTR